MKRLGVTKSCQIQTHITIASLFVDLNFFLIFIKLSWHGKCKIKWCWNQQEKERGNEQGKIDKEGRDQGAGQKAAAAKAGGEEDDGADDDGLVGDSAPGATGSEKGLRGLIQSGAGFLKKQKAAKGKCLCDKKSRQTSGREF